MYGSEWLLCLTERLQRQIPSLRNILLTTDVTHLQFKNCWVLLANQVTIHRKCSKHLPPQSMHARTRVIMQCRTLSKAAGRLRMVRQALKCVD